MNLGLGFAPDWAVAKIGDEATLTILP
jgi:hypothetical protein